MANSLLLHPIILMIAQSLVTTSTAAFTNRDSFLRYVSLLLISGISWLALSNFHDYINTTGWPGRIIAGVFLSHPLIFVDRLLLRRWAFGQDFLGPVGLPDAEKKKQSRWEFGSDVSSSCRCTGSEKEVANVPYFAQADPNYIPSWSWFLFRHICLIVGLYHLNTLCVDMQSRANRDLTTDDYIPFLSRLRDVSVDEIATRVQISIPYWVAQYCILHVLYSFFAVIGVCSKPEDLKYWRPIFGPMSSSYTIRRFWSKFWHQNIQLMLKGPADFITHKILRIPHGTFVARYSKIFFAFAVSGIMHVVSDSGGSVPIAESGALSFFCAQALGIILEDGAQEVYRNIFGNKYSGVCRAIGYFWVVTFLSWSTPVWVYPMVRSMKREDMLLTPNAIYPLISAFFKTPLRN